MTFDTTKPFITATVRHGLTVLAGYLVARGAISPTTSQGIVEGLSGLLVGLIGYGWSMAKAGKLSHALQLITQLLDVIPPPGSTITVQPPVASGAVQPPTDPSAWSMGTPAPPSVTVPSGAWDPLSPGPPASAPSISVVSVSPEHGLTPDTHLPTYSKPVGINPPGWSMGSGTMRETNPGDGEFKP